MTKAGRTSIRLSRASKRQLETAQHLLSGSQFNLSVKEMLSSSLTLLSRMFEAGENTSLLVKNEATKRQFRVPCPREIAVGVEDAPKDSMLQVEISLDDVDLVKSIADKINMRRGNGSIEIKQSAIIREALLLLCLVVPYISDGYVLFIETPSGEFKLLGSIFKKSTSNPGPGAGTERTASSLLLHPAPRAPSDHFETDASMSPAAAFTSARNVFAGAK